MIPFDKIQQLLVILEEQSDIYIFGGVIRNFLLGYPFHRDIDIVVCAKNNKILLPMKLLHGINISRNKFGGIKLILPHITIDIWKLSETWGILKKELSPTPYSLINTVFFNFSAIVFDYKQQRFIYGNDFLKFYKSRTMDIVFSHNPYPTACVISSCYYAQEYNFPIGKKLRQWISKQALEDDIESQQMNRYNEIKFQESVIKAFVAICKRVKNKNTSVCIHDINNHQYIFKFE